MVSLNFVTAVLGMVIFGNAEVVVRNLKSSTQQVASVQKKDLFTSFECPNLTKDTKVQAFTNLKCSWVHEPNPACHDSMVEAGVSILATLFNIDSDEVAPYIYMDEKGFYNVISRVLTGGLQPRDNAEAGLFLTQLLEPMKTYMRDAWLSSDIVSTDYPHADFLNRLVLIILGDCLMQ